MKAGILRGLAGLGLAALVLAAVPGTALADSARSDWKEIERILRLTMEIDPGAHHAAEDTFNYLNLLSFKADDFVAHYPKDSRRWDATVLKLRVAEQLAEFNHTDVDWAAEETGFAAVLAASDAKPDTRVAAQAGWFQARSQLQLNAGDAAAFAATARDLEAYYSKHRGDARVAVVALFVARNLRKADPDRAEAMLTKLAADGNGDLASQAASELRLVLAMKKPFELTFTAFDGRKVDVASLRGKVVLIDFWATWCPPCREETPRIVENYAKLRAQGFEIVGISLDESQSALKSYLAKNGMTWPQYFDGGGWDNKLAGRFDIHSIPAMWLLNKRGYLVDVDARDDLEGKLERLLAE